MMGCGKSAEGFCKPCLAAEGTPFAEIEAHMAEYLETIPEEDRVSEAVYQKRLATCNSCPALYYNSTCAHCGCFVRMRALRKNKSCPYPGNSKW